MKRYDKLIRDNVPHIIKNEGQKPHFHYAKDDELILALENKLREEVNEYLDTRNLEELADIMDVVYALGKGLGFSEKDIKEASDNKIKERGKFEKGIILEYVEE